MRRCVLVLFTATLLAPASASAQWVADGRLLCGAANAQLEPLVACPDRAGGAIFAWADTRTSGSGDLYAQRVSADGEPLWTADGVPVCTATGFQDLRGIVPDGLGGVILVWQDYRGMVQAYAQRLDANGNALWTADGVLLCTEPTSSHYDPVVASDGAGGAIAAWSDYRGGEFQGNIYAQHVGSNGALLWAATGVALCTEPNDQQYPKIASDGLGGAFVAWDDLRIGGPVEDGVWAQRVDAIGVAQWAADGIAVSDTAGNQILNSIDADGSGGAILAWSDERLSQYDIYGQRIDASGTPIWAARGVLVGEAPGEQLYPVVAADGQGGAFFVWEGGSLGCHVQSVSAGGLVRWAPDGIPAPPSLGYGEDPQLVLDGLGGVIVVFRDYSFDFGDVIAQRITAEGNKPWGDSGALLCGLTNQQRAPDIVSDGQGGAVVGWIDRRSGTDDVYAGRVTNDGVVEPPGASAWPEDGAVVATGEGVQQNPAIVSDDLGGAIVAWEGYVPASPGVSGGRLESGVDPDRALGPGHARLYAIKLEPTGVADLAWPQSGLQLSGSAGNTIEPECASDDSSGAFVVWRDDRNGDADLFAQHATDDGSIAAGWPADGAPVCVASGNQTDHVMVRDGAGGFYACWQDPRSGTSADIYAVRITSAGTVAPGWPANGAAVCVQPGDQIHPAACADGAGGLIVCWGDGRGADADVYAQRLAPGGSAIWSANGVAVCTSGGDQTTPVICGDGAGGAIVAWIDGRGANLDVYALRLGPGGAPVAGWTSGGAPLCLAAGDQTTPAIVSDDVGGALVAWSDGRVAGANVYVQRVLGNGSLPSGWSADGNALCTASGDQLAPSLVGDGHSGAIVSWEDHRGAAADVYATAIFSDGTLDPRYPVNGFPICDAANGQLGPVITTDGSGGAITGWNDLRNADSDVYAMHLFGETNSAVTAVGDGAPRIALVLTPPWPNPARDRVSLMLDLAAPARVSASVIEVSGRRVRTLDDGWAQAGRRALVWDGRDDAGRPVRAGIYLVWVRAGGLTAARRIAWVP